MNQNVIHYPHMATVKEAAQLFGLSQYYIRQLCRNRKIKYVCVGNRWLVNADTLASYLNEGEGQSLTQKEIGE